MTTPTPHPTFAPETLTAAGFPTISYDILDVGAEFRSDDCLIRPEDVETYAYAVEDYDPWFFRCCCGTTTMSCPPACMRG
jgi:hypothetical protein